MTTNETPPGTLLDPKPWYELPEELRSKIPVNGPKFEHYGQYERLKDIPQELRQQMPDEYWEKVIEGTSESPLTDSKLGRELYWVNVKDEEERHNPGWLDRMTREEFEAMVERILWRVLQRAKKAVWRFALLATGGVLVFGLISRLWR